MKMEEETEEDFILRQLQKGIRDRQEGEWSISASVGGRGRDIPVEQKSLHRTPPTPTPSEDRFVTDWSSLGSGSLPVRTPPQSVPVREIGPDINQPFDQTTQPGLEPAQTRVMENALQKDTIVSTPRTRQQLLDGLSVTNKRMMMDMGTNTLDIEVRPQRDGARASTLDANSQASLPIVDVMLPSGGGGQLAIPQINLSILGYEPDSLRDSHIRSPATRAQKISIMPQLDGPVSLPTRDPIGRRVQEDSRFAG